MKKIIVVLIIILVILATTIFDYFSGKQEPLVGGCAGVYYQYWDECCDNWASENNIVHIMCVGNWTIEDNQCKWVCETG